MHSISTERSGSVQLQENRKGEGERDGRRGEGIKGEKENAGTPENQVSCSSRGECSPLG